MKILHSNNPLNPAKGVKAYELPDGTTGNQAFKALGLPKSQPVVLIVDNEAWGRADWDKPLPVGPVVMFMDIQQGTSFLVGAIIAIIAAAGAYIYASSMSANVSNGADMGRRIVFILFQPEQIGCGLVNPLPSRWGG